jgi:hypothetical protein
MKILWTPFEAAIFRQYFVAVSCMVRKEICSYLPVIMVHLPDSGFMNLFLILLIDSRYNKIFHQTVYEEKVFIF